jgi:hypothetical protein
MADRAERAFGRQALVDAVVLGADRFFELYTRAAGS